jgi:CubicO group peptidase (beta-lactamase class C family)
MDVSRHDSFEVSSRKKEAATPETNFAIGSATKAFNAP